MIKKIIVISILLLPIASWTLYKPMRVLSPELNGITCISDTICIENKEKIDDAKLLYNEALIFVNSSVGIIKKNPRLTFCSSEQCYNSFGFYAPAKATTVGISGIVISPRGWDKYFIRHEIIHHLQSEHLGIIDQYLTPEWFKEGMPYLLSEDARRLKEPWETYKKKFETWYHKINKEELWVYAKEL